MIFALPREDRRCHLLNGHRTSGKLRCKPRLAIPHGATESEPRSRVTYITSARLPHAYVLPPSASDTAGGSTMRDTIAPRRSPNRSPRRESFHRLIQLGPIAALALPSFVWPCGAFELPFEEAVRRNLVQAGYINSYDVITPVALQLGPRRCEMIAPRPPKDACSCVGQRNPAYFLARAGA